MPKDFGALRARANRYSVAEDRKAFLFLCDAYEHVSGERPAVSAFDPFVEALRSRSRTTLEMVGPLIADLMYEQQFVRDRLIDVMKPGRSFPRSAVIVYVLYWIRHPVPEPLRSAVLEITGLGLAQGTSRIRRFTADRIMSMELHEMIPALDDCIAAENDPKTKNSIQWNRDILRDGYILKPLAEGDNCYQLTLLHPFDRRTGRSDTTLTLDVRVPVRVMQRLGIQEVVERLRVKGESVENLQMPKLFRVVLQVNDIERATFFYTRLLIMPGKRVSRGQHYFQCGGTIVACFDPRAEGENFDAKPNPDHFYFAVPDLDEVFQIAQRIGCQALDAAIQTRPWGERSFCVKDPFGNLICFVDEKTIFTG